MERWTGRPLESPGPALLTRGPPLGRRKGSRPISARSLPGFPLLSLSLGHSQPALGPRDGAIVTSRALVSPKLWSQGGVSAPGRSLIPHPLICRSDQPCAPTRFARSVCLSRNS